MSDFVRNLIRFLLFTMVQVYVLNKIPHLHQFITPYIYFLYLLWLPFNISRIGLLITAFVTGMALDFFTMTPGLHAAACVLLAYARPFVINILTPKDSSEFNYREPSPKALGWTPYLVYVFVLTLLHHGYLTLLEWLSFGTFLQFLIKIVATTAISMLLIITTALLFPRRMKFRTNTA
ncbi:MAG TPA: rod shape-determining protein MreD [Chitinophagaceae bacterium]|nr:rod shape-determining protein MreD [Chitinophagaceae bacterium]